jgi:GTPase SAR1 family protein
LAVTPDGKTAVSASFDQTLRVWDLPEPDTVVEVAAVARYTNAKVVLAGETGVGKTGLALRLAEDRWQETGSTHGMNVWQLHLPHPFDSAQGRPSPPPEGEGTEMEREVWLWDFAGQPDYRLIHQLYMDETALALMVIDPQRDDPFEPLGHWEKALQAAVKHVPAKMLIAARCDRGGLTISQSKVDQYCDAQDYSAYLNTAAKTGEGCEDLKTLIAQHIPWDRLPWTATSRLFKTLKEAIIRIKEEDIVLTRISELRQRLQLELRDEAIEEDKLRAVVGLLAGQGIIQKLDFGDFVLLQPEQINNYASAVVRSARESTDEMGVVSERAVLEAELDFKDMKRLDEADEKILLRAMLQTFLDRSLCVREETSLGTQLVFPSYFKQNRPALSDHPHVFVTYGFSGTLDEIYSTLVVRLHYTHDFEMDQLWRYAADFTTLAGKRVGLVMDKKADDAADLCVYFEADIPVDTQVSFIKYIHEHLLKRAQDVTRVRSYVCTHCATLVKDLDVVRKRLEAGKDFIYCQNCDEKVPLHDLIEQKFASDAFVRAVQEMDAQAQINLDNESLELILVGHAITIAAEAGQIFRPVAWADWGIDGEIEFKDHEGRASGQRVYLQLKSGDSYLRTRKSDDKEIFRIKNPRHAEYWHPDSQKYPVMLVIRTSDGRIRWMNVSDYLERHGKKTKQIVFEGEPFTALNVVRLRDRVLAASGMRR